MAHPAPGTEAGGGAGALRTRSRALLAGSKPGASFRFVACCLTATVAVDGRFGGHLGGTPPVCVVPREELPGRALDAGHVKALTIRPRSAAEEESGRAATAPPLPLERGK